MKHFLRIILGGICLSSLLAGCADNAAIEELKNQLEELKSSQIASINTQISNIRKSIEDLEGVDRDLNTLISNLQKGLEEQGEDLDGLEGRINDLVSEDQALSARITELKTDCEQQDDGIKSWAEVTFATLEQHSAVLTEISTIKNSLSALSQAIDNLDASLTGKIAEAESSIKGWVNEQLTGYYTIAQTEAKLKMLEDGYVAGDQALAGEIETLRQNLDQAKANLTTAYQTAISTAITENNGTINQKIAADIKTASDALQDQINTLSERLNDVESRLSSLEANLAKIINMVQSVVVIPDYPDGSVKMTNGTENKIRFEIYPLTAASSLAALGTSALSLDCVETGTKASIFTNIPISAVAFDGEVFTITADGSGLSDAISSGLTSANARLRISDGTTTRSSDYFRLAFNGAPSGGGDSGDPSTGDGASVTIGTEHLSAISVVLKGKANLGDTAYSDLMIGFQYSLSPGILPSNSTTVEPEKVDAAYNYSTSITGLEPSTTYYFRSFIRQNGVDTYGSTRSFTTKDLASLIHTEEASAVSAISCQINASLDLTDVKFSKKTIGFYWGTSAEYVSMKVSANVDDTVISATRSGLTPSKQYYFRAYATFDGKEYRSNVQFFTTKDISSLLETLDASGIEATSATLNAKLDLTDAIYSSLEYGFYRGTSASSQSTMVSGSSIIDNTYSASLTGLSHKKQYWYKSYVKLDSQTFYGEVKSFTTDVVPVESVSLDKTEYTFNTIGNTLTLKATVLPTDATDKSISWKSSDESVATVDNNGKVTAIGNGTATITVTTTDQEKSAICAVTVAQYVTGITLDKTSLSLNEGDNFTFTATISPANAADKSLTWTSSNAAIATVDEKGTVTAVSKGSVTITAKANDGSGKQASCQLTVKRLVSSIELNKASLVLLTGKSETLTATVSPTDANNTSISWSSSNTTLATVSTAGIVTAKAPGNVTITATAKDGSGVSASCDVEIRQAVTGITLGKSALPLNEGENYTFTTTITPDNAYDKTLEWTSSDESVATVDENGKVTAVSKGSATIKATANDGSGVFASCAVWVKEPYTAVAGEAVDLGLSVKWSSTNLGATSPSDYGDYFSWGETSPKYNYSWETYELCNGSSSTLTKYNNSSSYGAVDNKSEFKDYGYADDAARQALGGKWRMPTDAEWTELRTKCTWTWTTNYNGTGVSGRIVTATNGNSIFLPAAGYRYDTNLGYAGDVGRFWSSSLHTDNPDRAWHVYFSSDGMNGASYSRFRGISVRPVSE